MCALTFKTPPSGCVLEAKHFIGPVSMKHGLNNTFIGKYPNIPKELVDYTASGWCRFNRYFLIVYYQ